MKKDMPLEGLRWSRDSGSALYDTPQTAVLGRAGGGSWVYSTYWMSEARDKDNAYIMDVDSEWIDYKVELSYMNKVCGGTIRPVSD